MNNPLVSVIVPVYHVETTLRQCLDSLLRQSFRDFEILLINDGGSAEDTAICEEYASSDRRIVYRVQPNQGLSAARNTGLSLARGRWIMFVDSDDWVHEDFIQNALAAADKDAVQMVIFDLDYMNNDGVELGPHRSGLTEGIYSSEIVLRERLTGSVACYAWNKLYAHDLWEKMSFPYGEQWEDDAIIHELIDRCDKIAVIHDILYFKRNREESITGIACRENTQTYWLFVQRKRRFFYIRKNHPELMVIENRTMASTAVHYAVSLVAKGKDEEVRNISGWLRQLKLPAENWSLKLRAACSLLKRSPRLFSFAIKLWNLKE